MRWHTAPTVSAPAIAATLLLVVGAAWAAPADRVPTPRAEPCIKFDPDLAENDIAMPSGLDYDQVRGALNGVIQAALYCPRPEGLNEVHLTFELLVGCDGIVSSIEAVDTGGAPQTYVDCVASVVKKADFPAHDMESGMPVTYPVNVSW